MTLEEKAEEYANEKCKDCYMCSYSECKNPYEVCEKRQCRKQAFLAGLHEGQEENNRLKEQIEKMKCCGNCKSQGELAIHEPCVSCKRGYGKDYKDKFPDKWELEK